MIYLFSSLTFSRSTCLFWSIPQELRLIDGIGLGLSDVIFVLLPEDLSNVLLDLHIAAFQLFEIQVDLALELFIDVPKLARLAGLHLRQIGDVLVPYVVDEVAVLRVAVQVRQQT